MPQLFFTHTKERSLPQLNRPILCGQYKKGAW